MKKLKKRRCSLRITLALISTISIGCEENGYRQVYENREDCLTEQSSENCEPCEQGSTYYRPGRFYGPFILYMPMYRDGYKSKSVATMSTTRGGFGPSHWSHSSGG
jgi:uncharacterized protein YgiB involved in biofilm formation